MKNKTHIYFIFYTLFLFLKPTNLHCSMGPNANQTATKNPLKQRLQKSYKQSFPNTASYEEQGIEGTKNYLEALKKTNPTEHETLQKIIEENIKTIYENALSKYKTMNDEEQAIYTNTYVTTISTKIKNAINEEDISEIANLMVEAHYNIAENPALGEDSHQRFLKKVLVPIRMAEQKLEAQTKRDEAATPPLTEKYNAAKNIADNIIKKDTESREQIEKHTQEHEEWNTKLAQKNIYFDYTKDTTKEIVMGAGINSGTDFAASILLSGWKYLINDKSNKKEISKIKKETEAKNKKIADLFEKNEVLLNPPTKKTTTKRELTEKLELKLKESR